MRAFGSLGDRGRALVLERLIPHLSRRAAASWTWSGAPVADPAALGRPVRHPAVAPGVSSRYLAVVVERFALPAERAPAHEPVAGLAVHRHLPPLCVDPQLEVQLAPVEHSEAVADPVVPAVLRRRQPDARRRSGASGRGRPLPRLAPRGRRVGSGSRWCLASAIDQLAPTFREVVRLRDIEDRLNAEVAVRLHISKRNVAQRLHRAHRLLRRRLRGHRRRLRMRRWLAATSAGWWSCPSRGAPGPSGRARGGP